MISVWLSTKPVSRVHVCKIAGQTLLLDELPELLAPFASDDLSISPTRRPLVEPFAANEPPVCSIKGLIAEQERLVRLWVSEAHYVVEVEGAGRFAVSRSGEQIVHLDAGEDTGADAGASDIDPYAVMMVLLGPVLALALAAHRVFYLHASAFQIGDFAVALTGVSGAGKSTLAAYLHVQGWRSLSDDILPLTRTQNDIEALPHYPQLRLGTHQFTGVGAPERLPLQAIYLLDVPPDVSVPRIEAVQPRDAMRTLLFESVGVSIFPPDLIKAHMDFCSEVQALVPVKRLIYPHQRAVLPMVRRLLEADLV